MQGISRRLARELAFQFLYGYLPEANPKVASDHDREDFSQFCANFGHPLDDFAWRLVEGTGKFLPTLDQKLGELAAKSRWKTERMARVDLTILRMGAFEILHGTESPKTVAINEAVELAKRFGTEDSASFINAILDNIDPVS